MDPVAHTFFGAALAQTGLRRTTPLAGTTLIVAANAPDVDVLAMFGGQYFALAYRRGLTHGVLALALWPFVIVAAVWLFDRYVRRRRDPEAAPIRAGPVLGLAALGVVSHPLLDWLNNYGMRWLLPFDGRWSYGDAWFIIDPWVWIGLGGVLFLGHSRTRAGVAAWVALWALMTALVLAQGPAIPFATKALWLAASAVFAGLRLQGVGGDERGAAHLARGAIGLAVAYAAVMVGTTSLAEGVVRRDAEARGLGPVEDVMVAPVPGNPFGGQVVVATPEAYHRARFSWLAAERLDYAPIPIRRRAPDRVYEAATRTPDVRRYLVWSRYPFHEVSETPDGWLVRVGDARYVDAGGAGGLQGVSVRLDRALRPAPD